MSPENTGKALCESAELLAELTASINIIHSQHNYKPISLLAQSEGDHKLQSTPELLTKQIIISKPHKQKQVESLSSHCQTVLRFTQLITNKMGRCRLLSCDPPHNFCQIIPPHCNIYKVQKHYISELWYHATFCKITYLLEGQVLNFQAPEVSLLLQPSICGGFTNISRVLNEAYIVSNVNSSCLWNSEALPVKLMEPETP